MPYLFPTPAMTGGLPARPAVAVHADAGRFAYDTMTLVGPGTWAAARAAVDCALTAADLVAAGQPLAYALCRPPGHHATRAGFGGSCYLNNAAVAAESLRHSGHPRVAVIDIDAHHGNGTAAIFYGRSDVLYGSVHVDPGAGWFPHVVGYADEQGSGAGAGATMNLPLPEGTTDDRWLEAVRDLVEWARKADCTALVVSLGVDAAKDDPESPLLVSREGYQEAGVLIGATGTARGRGAGRRLPPPHAGWPGRGVPLRARVPARPMRLVRGAGAGRLPCLPRSAAAGDAHRSSRLDRVVTSSGRMSASSERCFPRSTRGSALDPGRRVCDGDDAGSEDGAGRRGRMDGYGRGHARVRDRPRPNRCRVA